MASNASRRTAPRAPCCAAPPRIATSVWRVRTPARPDDRSCAGPPPATSSMAATRSTPAARAFAELDEPRIDVDDGGPGVAWPARATGRDARLAWRIVDSRSSASVDALKHRFGHSFQLCTHLGFRLDVGGTHDHTIGAGIEERPHDVFLGLLPVNRDGDRLGI